MKAYTGLIAFYWVKIVLLMYIGFQLQPTHWPGHLLMILTLIGPVMLLFSVPLFTPDRYRKWVFPALLFLMTFWMYAHLLYYRFYEDFITLTILLQIGNVGGLSRSTWELFSPWDLLLFLDILVVGWVLFKKETFQLPPKKWYLGVASLLTITMLAAGLLYKPYVLKENYNRTQFVQTMSLFTYQLFDVGHSIRSPLFKWVSDPSDAEPMQAHVKEQEKETTEWFGEAEGMNIVFIGLESVQNFVLDLEVDGQEVTPFLNKIKDESFYFSNLYEQTAQGKSSDAEFMIDTGLYPLDGGSVFVRRPDNAFHGLPEILGNYQSAVFHGNERSFWNRTEMYDTLGYDRFFSERDYKVTEENSINYGLEDHHFFEQSIPTLKELDTPYLAKFITLTNHFPFLLHEEDQTFETDVTSEPVVNRYLSTVHYLDQSVETFIEKLQEQEMYENTMFILYGDHYGVSTEYEDGLFELLDQPETTFSHIKNQRVPVLIHIPGLQGEVFDEIAGQIDIRATVLHLLGKRSANYMSFSENLLTRKHDAFVTFRNGNYISESTMYVKGQCLDTEKGTPLSNQACEKGRSKARSELQLSDQVIKGDWLRYKE
ncbi:LTA synthase family protein [Halobacillus trueperi]|uniref:LTA synthase family protein n=1 Tax=Halobacillus trueperi TaxID=156205 RepID=A0A3D8VPB3_9BACI|nr:LTA synthase family protein [Halobacillus trueperi]RDY70638.1 LTA synthase family protein [Halobacillus trueperi]